MPARCASRRRGACRARRPGWRENGSHGKELKGAGGRAVDQVSGKCNPIAAPRSAEQAVDLFGIDMGLGIILSVNYASVGVGIAFNGRQWLLVQDFAGQ